MSRLIELILLSLGVQSLSIFWIITDPRPKNERLFHYLKPRTLFLALAQIVLFCLQLINILNFPNVFFSNSKIVLLLGLLIYGTGLFLAVWAKNTMKSSWGTPFQHDIKRQNKLITTGPYKFTRNPIYLGLLLVCFGFFLALQSYLIFVTIVFFIYFYLSIVKEEKLLTKYFGEKYINYLKKVRRFLFF